MVRRRALTLLGVAVLLGGGAAWAVLTPVGSTFLDGGVLESLGIEQLSGRAPTGLEPEKGNMRGDLEEGQVPAPEGEPGAPAALAAAEFPWEDGANRVDARKSHVRSFFQPPKLDPRGDHVVEPQPVRWLARCPGSDAPGFDDLSAHVGQRGLPRARIPLGTDVRNLNFFFSDASRGRYLQLSMTPVLGDDGQNAAGFEIVLFESDRDDLSTEKSRGRIAPAAGKPPLGREEALKAMGVLADGFRKDGFLEGARGLVYALPGAEEDEGLVELVGGKVTRLDEGPVTCHAAQGTAECACAESRGGPE